jgi:hypothetical protein
VQKKKCPLLKAGIYNLQEGIYNYSDIHVICNLRTTSGELAKLAIELIFMLFAA